MTVSGARQHLTALARAGLVEAAEMPSTDAQAWPPDARVLRDRGRRPATSRRRTASSPTSCSVTSPTPTPRCSKSCSPSVANIASTTRRRGSRSKRTLGAKVAELAQDPRRRRLSRDLREGRARRVPRRSSTTARSGRSRSATARRAPARSTSSAPCSPRRRSNACSTWSPAPATARTRSETAPEPSQRKCVTGNAYSAASRSAMSERWHASGSRSTQSSADVASVGITATIGARSTWSRISRR